MLNADRTQSQDEPSFAAGEPIGHVVSVRGSQATVGLSTPRAPDPSKVRSTVGKFLGIHAGDSLLVGVITNVSIDTPTSTNECGYHSTADLDLVGEIKQPTTAQAQFQRGVTEYPAIGDPVLAIGTRELKLVFNPSGSSTIEIGHLSQDSTITAYVDVDDMLSKHFAVLGTTGVGKSSAVVLMLHEILRARPDLRIFVLDAHNEYGRPFGDRALVINPRNLRLPFWLFNFEEIVDVLFGARAGSEEEVYILSEAIPRAKVAYSQYRAPTDRSLIKRGDRGSAAFSVDTPVPYRLADLIGHLDERMGKLENRSSRMIYHRLITRIESVCNDPRYCFMFENANVGGDTMAEVLSQLFRLPANGKPITVMQLAGFPSEVVDAVVSVVCRMAFDLGLWSEGAAPLLLVCEEAHRYASADRSIGFGPTRRSISRIAKEGRKHGVFLGLVSQRPAELDATITSQCSTLFAMRMINDRDQSILRSAVSDAAANLLDFLPSLGTAEVFAFGEGVAMPTRIKLKQLPAHQLPKSDAVSNTRGDAGLNEEFIATVLKRWRGDTTGVSLDDGTRDPRLQDAKSLDARSFDGKSSDGKSFDARSLDAKSFDTKPFDAKSFDTKPFEQNAVPPLQPEQPAEPPRFGTLKRQFSDRLDVSRAFQAPAKPHR
jgi:DNA helicase HerA-like ATPase